MKKSDLRNGMILEKHNGQRGIYQDGIMVSLTGKRLSHLSSYNEDLIAKVSNKLGILKVFDSNFNLIFFNDKLKENRNLNSDIMNKDIEKIHEILTNLLSNNEKLIRELENKNINASWQKGKSEGLLYTITLLENEFDY